LGAIEIVAKEKVHAKAQRNAKAQRRVKDSDAPEAFDPSLRLCVKYLLKCLEQ